MTIRRGGGVPVLQSRIHVQQACEAVRIGAAELSTLSRCSSSAAQSLVEVMRRPMWHTITAQMSGFIHHRTGRLPCMQRSPIVMCGLSGPALRPYRSGCTDLLSRRVRAWIGSLCSPERLFLLRPPTRSNGQEPATPHWRSATPHGSDAVAMPMPLAPGA